MTPPRRWFAAAVVAMLVGCSASPGPATGEHTPLAIAGAVTALRVEVIDELPHDAQAFTQGLELHEGMLYESTGRYGESDVRIVVPETGALVAREPLPADVFGEGLTIAGDQVWQLTWREETAFRWDRESLTERDPVSYEGEGWGLCYDAGRDRLVMSDGTPELTFRDPATFAVTGSVTVTHGGAPLPMINELECVDDRVWANVWLTDGIVRIDPSTGAVDALVDAAGLLPEPELTDPDAVLNGIAAVPGTDTFLITGKLWPTLFLVRFVPMG